MAALKFEQDAEENDTKIALSMTSKDAEIVALSTATDCDGQV